MSIIVRSNNAFRSFRFRNMDFLCCLPELSSYIFYDSIALAHSSFFSFVELLFSFFAFSAASFFCLVSCWSILFPFMWISFVETVVLYSSIWIIVSHFHKNDVRRDETATIAPTMTAMAAVNDLWQLLHSHCHCHDSLSRSQTNHTAGYPRQFFHSKTYS